MVFQKYPSSSRDLKGNEQNIPKIDDFMRKYESGRFYEGKNQMVFQKYPPSSRILKGNEQNVPQFDDCMRKYRVQ